MYKDVRGELKNGSGTLLGRGHRLTKIFLFSVPLVEGVGCTSGRRLDRLVGCLGTLVFTKNYTRYLNTPSNNTPLSTDYVSQMGPFIR